MTISKYTIVIVSLLSHLYLSGEPIEIKPVADTYIKGESPEANFGKDTEMRVRSFDNSTDVRYQVAYFKFDFSLLGDINPGVEFQVTTQPETKLWNEGQIQVYGLLEKEGNTPESWDPNSLTFATTGNELSKPYEFGEDPLQADQLELLGDLSPPDEAGGKTSFSSDALDTFILNAKGDDQQATLLLVPEFLSNRLVELNSSESGEDSPLLLVDSDTTSKTTVEFTPEADTWVRIEKTIGEPRDEIIADMTFGDDELLRIRSLDATEEGGAVREFPAYIRFNLSNLSGELLPGAEFLIIADGNKAWSATQVKLYGLIDGEGHTPQDWDEATLNWNTIGDEIDQSLLGNDYVGMDEVRIDGPFMMDAPASADLKLESGIIPIRFSGAAMDEFIEKRRADNGLVTFVLMNRPDSNRDIHFFSSEYSAAGVRPQLTVSTMETSGPENWAGFEILEGGDVQTDGMLGWLNVKHAPWIWSYSLGNYVFLQESNYSTDGFFMFVPNFSSNKISDGWTSVEADQNGDIELKQFLGWVNIRKAPWIWSYNLNNYIYISDSYLYNSGTWIYILQ